MRSKTRYGPANSDSSVTGASATKVARERPPCGRLRRQASGRDGALRLGHVDRDLVGERPVERREPARSGQTRSLRPRDRSGQLAGRGRRRRGWRGTRSPTSCAVAAVECQGVQPPVRAERIAWPSARTRTTAKPGDSVNVCGCPRSQLHPIDAAQRARRRIELKLQDVVHGERAPRAPGAADASSRSGEHDAHRPFRTGAGSARRSRACGPPRRTRSGSQVPGACTSTTARRSAGVVDVRAGRLEDHVVAPQARMPPRRFRASRRRRVRRSRAGASVTPRCGAIVAEPRRRGRCRRRRRRDRA